MIHGYDTVDFDRMWKIIEDDLPMLIEQLQSIAEESDES